jgi:uncharacterized protein Veg
MQIGNSITIIEATSDTASGGRHKTKRTGEIIAIYPHYVVVEFIGARNVHGDRPKYRRCYLKVDIKYNLERQFEVSA